MLKFTVLFMLFLSFALYAKSQLATEISLQGGEDYASFGYYGNINGAVSYQLKDWNFSTAAGINLSHAKDKIFNALKFDLLRSFKIKSIPFKGELFYQWKPYSERLYEHNMALVVHYNPKNFQFQLGHHTRLYHLPKNYVITHNYTDQDVWEAFNLIYKASYVQPINEQLKLKFSITNFDAFVIQQETNPMVILNTAYDLSSNSLLSFDLGYLQAGFFNMRVNYFGYFTRLTYHYQF